MGRQIRAHSDAAPGADRVILTGSAGILPAVKNLREAHQSILRKLVAASRESAGRKQASRQSIPISRVLTNAATTIIKML
jgi:orotate phosphoribosyltransferase